MSESDRIGTDGPAGLDRRHFLGYLAATGLGGTLLPGALLAVAQEAPEIKPEMVAAAAKIAGLALPPEAEKAIAEGLNRRGSLLEDFQALRDLGLGNDTPSALVFNPVLPGTGLPSGKSFLKTTRVRAARPRTDEDLAFLPVTHLAALLKKREIKSLDLAKLCLDRLKKYDPVLHCVVTLTEDLALEQAARADREIAAGRYRGPLHGVPWGAKDLLAVKGYRTTFGASPFKDQTIDRNATVFERLTGAGAVLVAKLTLGALAMGDRWFGGQTKSPWDPRNPGQGSSGSSAGPASAVAAGLVPFAIGSETRGSIISPASRCGVSGLRPSFGRVSRYGAMALSWTMDKLGPLCRAAEDCAIVLHAINGPDGRDNTVLDVPFAWDAGRDVRKLRVGYIKSDVEREISDDPKNPERVRRQREAQAFARASLETIRGLGVEPVPVELPKLGSGPMDFLLTAEGAAAFDGLVRSDKLDQMSAEPERSAWVGSFRLHEFVPAVQYIQANRARYRLMEAYRDFFKDMDVLIGSALGPTNLTGHPEIAIPQGFDSKGQPSALRLTGRLFGEADLLLLAHAFQMKTDFHLRRPKLD
ncbi:MAG: Amidase [Candidatus Aminicenantes bacterium]|jgi:Asp-tRNA(Asn)/Glu-tRNA(Gln) amidotransferase A subunit family amidase|nr:Amidase [Candidatus Aminicenantes bacterium]